MGPVYMTSRPEVGFLQATHFTKQSDIVDTHVYQGLAPLANRRTGPLSGKSPLLGHSPAPQPGSLPEKPDLSVTGSCL